MNNRYYKSLLLLLILLLWSGGTVLTAQVTVMPMEAVYRFGAVKEKSDSLILKGYVYDATRKPLLQAYAVPIDSAGEPGDTLYMRHDFDPIGIYDPRTSICFLMQTDRRDSTYVFEVGCEGYTPQTIVYRVENLRKRELTRQMPAVTLEREPYKLKEVEVVASKVKFYHNGDTLVYNADAFMLSNGAVLEDLISQLPGVELKDDGQITVNGERVESLLLNGKDFFSSDRDMMLKNLGAYTVDKVQVYRGQTLIERWEDDPNAERHLTMDVKLKKEYSVSTIINALAGYGTNDRYVAKMFVTGFNNSTSAAIVGNINNLNDNMDLGRHNITMSSRGYIYPGTDKRVSMTYNHQPDFNRQISGDVSFATQTRDQLTSTDRTDFLSSGDIYNYSHGINNSRSMQLSARTGGMCVIRNFNLSGNVSASLSRNRNSSDNISASFNEGQTATSADNLKEIYGDGSRESLEALINRSISGSESKGTNFNVMGNFNGRLKIPSLSDIITLSLTANYSTNESRQWNDYQINYGDNPVPSDTRRQFTDNSPNHNLNLSGYISYHARFGNMSLTTTYNSTYSDRKSDSYLYSLHLLDELTTYGELPEGYKDVFDPYQSYMSTDNEANNSLNMTLEYLKDFADGKSLRLSADPKLAVIHRSMDYFKNNKTYNVGHSTFVPSVSNLAVSFGNSSYVGLPSASRRNTFNLRYSYSYNVSMPQLMSLVDVVDDRNPLYIEEGNPNLKNQQTQQHDLGWSWQIRHMSNYLRCSYSIISNNIVRGVMYDTETGVRRVKSYNVDGNYNYGLYERMDLTFNKDMHNFQISATVRANKSHSLTMISTDGGEPEKTGVDTHSYLGGMEFSWYRGLLRVSAEFNADRQLTTSASDNLNNTRATNLSYGVDAFISTRFGLELIASLDCHTRMGYGSKELDKTDMMLNAAVSYTPSGSNWTVKFQGYDLLHSLSYINYAVSSTGKTVSVTNSIPRYILATVQYRFSFHPKGNAM